MCETEIKFSLKKKKILLIFFFNLIYMMRLNFVKQILQADMQFLLMTRKEWESNRILAPIVGIGERIQPHVDKDLS